MELHLIFKQLNLINKHKYKQYKKGEEEVNIEGEQQKLIQKCKN